MSWDYSPFICEIAVEQNMPYDITVFIITHSAHCKISNEIEINVHAWLDKNDFYMPWDTLPSLVTNGLFRSLELSKGSSSNSL